MPFCCSRGSLSYVLLTYMNHNAMFPIHINPDHKCIHSAVLTIFSWLDMLP